MPIKLDDLMGMLLVHSDGRAQDIGGGEIRGAGVVGDTVLIKLATPLTGRSGTNAVDPSIVLTTKPGGSSTAVSGMGLTAFDQNGEYIVTVTNGQLTKAISIVAVPAAAKTFGPWAATSTRGNIYGDMIQKLVQGKSAAAIANMTNGRPYPWLVDADHYAATWGL